MVRISNLDKMKKLLEKSIGLYFNILAFLSPTIAAKKGFALFCNPMVQKLKPYQNAFLETGKDTILQYEDLKIQTYKWGKGSKKVLLIHGWASNTFRWKAYVEYLIENDFTVYALDAPAHGFSSGKMLNLLLYSNIINLFFTINKEVKNIISHSIGGFATVFCLHEQKENNIQKVVIMGAPGEAQDFLDFYQSTLSLSKKMMKILNDEFKVVFGNAPNFYSAAKFAKEIKAKGLIIHDKEDKDTNYENSVRLQASWSDSQLILTEGLGHSLKSKPLMEDVHRFICNS
jgi:pimeloyl-ACP methyl ester carboxylesterase